MANSSYCRYENTARDLKDCVEAIDTDGISETASDREIEGLRDLLLLAKEVVDREDEILDLLGDS